MTEIPTVRIKSDNPLGYAIINQGDYDASVHELWEEAKEESAKDVAPVFMESSGRQLIEAQARLDEIKQDISEQLTESTTEQPVRKRRERKSEVAE